MYEGLQQTIEQEGDFDAAFKSWAYAQMDQLMDASHWNAMNNLETKVAIAKEFWEVFTGRRNVFSQDEFNQYYYRFIDTLHPNTRIYEGKRRAEEIGQDIMFLIDGLFNQEGHGASSFGIGAPQRDIEIRKLVETGLFKPEVSVVLGGALPTTSVDEFAREFDFLESEGVLKTSDRTLIDLFGYKTKEAAEERGMNFLIRDLRKPEGVKADLFVSDLVLLGLLETDGDQIAEYPNEVQAATKGVQDILNPGGVAIMYDVESWDFNRLFAEEDVDVAVVRQPLILKTRLDVVKWFLNPTADIDPGATENNDFAVVVIARKRDGSEKDAAFKKLYGLE